MNIIVRETSSNVNPIVQTVERNLRFEVQITNQQPGHKVYFEKKELPF